MGMKFGTTWWGKKWLDTMNYIDYSNRLPRGRSYASSNSVESIEIENAEIVAKVMGTSIEPYTVTLRLKRFTKKHSQSIMDIIWKNPVFLSKMLAGEMPEDLNDVFLEEEIKLFPENWNEVFGECSCLDIAIPCKHIAAVIYMLANEIDKNPFIIFKLHGFDIEKELEKLGKESQGKVSIKNLDEGFRKELEVNESKEFEYLDFSKIPYLRKDIFTLLNKRPLFASSVDYRRVLEKAYIKIEKDLAKHIDEDNIFEEDNINSLDFKFYLTEDFKNEFLILKENDNFNILKNDNLDEFIKSLENISSQNLKNYSDNTKVIHNIYRYSLILMEKGAFIPEILSSKEETYKIRWIPALFNNYVKDAFNKIKESININTVNITQSKAKNLSDLENLLREDVYLEENIKKNNAIYSIKNYKTFLTEVICMEELEKSPYKELFQIKQDDLYYNIEKVTVIHPKIKEKVDVLKDEILEKEFLLENKKDAYLSLDDQIFQWINFFIKHFIKKNYDDTIAKKEYKINSMFFLENEFKSEYFHEREVPNSINLWLNKLHLSLKDHSIVLKIEDKDEKFDISLLVEEKKDFSIIEFEEIMNEEKHINLRLEILKDLNVFLSYFPELEIIINSKGKETLVREYKEFEDILFKIIPILQSLGIKMMLPKGLEDIIRPKVSMTMSRNDDRNLMSYLHLEELLSFDWKIALGDELVSIDEFKNILKGTKGLVKIKNRFVYVDEKEMNSLLKNLKKPKLSSNEILKAALDESLDNKKVIMSKEAESLINELLKAEDVEIPDELNAELRDYQRRGYNWLYKNYKLGLGSLMADDMGLGKTIQVITLLLKLKAEKKDDFKQAFIVVPTTLLTNWEKEVEKFAPSLKTCVYHGLKREIDKEADIVITSYGIVRTDIDILKKTKWDTVIIDEAQNIKNPNTDQTKAIKKLKSNHKIALTGTPVENKLIEYWSIFDYTNKGYLGNIKMFKKNYAIPIEIRRNAEKLESFRKISSPFIIRRMKTDKTIIKDLPEKIEIDEYCKLFKDQLGLYQNVVDETLEKVKYAEGIERKGLIFKLMTSLKQICNHPAHYMKRDTAHSDLSGKTKLLVDLLKKILENNEKVLIFTQYKEMGKLIQEIIRTELNTESLFFHGGLTRKKRDEFVERFQEDKLLKIMVLSLKAGGTGLNLTKANNVIHFDLWWNPAVESQATDRAYRIGQHKNVMVYRLISENTFEEKINKMIMNKKELADMTVSVGEKWIGEFSDTELSDLFSVE